MCEDMNVICLQLTFGSVGPGFGKHSTSFKENLLSVLSKHGNQCSVIDRRPMLQRYAAGPCHSIPCTADNEALSKAKKEVRLAFNFL